MTPAIQHRPPQSQATRRTLHVIAAFEAIKGIAALAGLLGILDLVHHDVRHLAIELIGYFHLSPKAHYPSVLLHYVDLLPDANLQALILMASAYIALRLLESYGLWHDRAWGEWLGTLSGGLYIPLELSHLIHRPSLITGLVMVSNIFLVAFLSFQLWRRHQAAARPSAAHP